MDNKEKSLQVKSQALDLKTLELVDTLDKLSDISVIKVVEIEEEFNKKSLVLLEAYNNGSYEILELIDKTLELYVKIIKKTNKAIKKLSK